MAQNSESTEAELVRRHRTAAMVVGATLGLTIALVCIAYVYSEALHRPGDRSLAMGLSITILILGLGSFALRRSRFQTARLQDIAALRGISGLLSSLQSTTIQIALIGGAIALLGFIMMMISPERDWFHMLRAGAVAAIVLIAAYPQRSAWQRLVRSVEQPPADVDDSPAKGIVA